MNNSGNESNKFSISKESAEGFLESMKNRMGIGDPESNKTDAFEKGKKIVPDCVKPNDGEVPVKQYEVATLRNRIFGISYSKAKGRVQVTNKRVVFRAPGRSFAGRSTLQHEFAIDEIAGLEARKEFTFSFWDLLIGFIVMAIGGSILTALATSFASGSDGVTVALIFAYLLGPACCVPFFLVKKKWLVKLLCLGGAMMTMFSVGGSATGGAAGFFGTLLQILGLIPLALAIFTLVVYSIKPNLVLVMKTKGATDAISIKRRKKALGLFGGGKDEENTGFDEVLFEDETELCIREINAIITDIQKLGDFGIEKWKA